MSYALIRVINSSETVETIIEASPTVAATYLAIHGGIYDYVLDTSLYSPSPCINYTYDSILDSFTAPSPILHQAIIDINLPMQQGNAGSVLTTDGSASSWMPSSGGGGEVVFNPSTSSGVLFEDFYAYQYAVGTPQGPMNLLMNATGSGTAVKDATASSETNRFGIVKFTGASTDSAGFYTNFNAIYAGGSVFTVAMAVQLGTNIPTDSSNSWVGTWGAGNGWPSNPNGAYFQITKDSPNFICVTYNGSINTFTDSGVPYAANTWYNFRVTAGPASALFYIDGVLVATNTTTLPVGTYGNIFLACTNQTGPGFSTRVDWVSAEFTPTAPRGADLLTTGGSGIIQSWAGHIVAPTTYTYVIDQAAAYSYNINSFAAQLSAGTIVGAIQINGVSITSMSAMALSSTPSVNTPTALNVVAMGNRVTLVTSSPVSAADLTYTLAYTRT